MPGDQKKLIPKSRNAEGTYGDSAQGVDNKAFKTSCENLNSTRETHKPTVTKEHLQKALLKAVQSSIRMKERIRNPKRNNLNNANNSEQLRVLVNPAAPQLNESPTEPEEAQGCNAVESETPPELPRKMRRKRPMMEMFVLYLREFSHSWAMILVLLTILVWPCFYIYLGLRYLHECDFLTHFPVLYVFMGVSGIAAIASRIFRNILKMHPRFSRRNVCSFCNYTTNLGVFVFSVVYSVGALLFLSISGEPSNEPGPLYCATTFYTFTRWNMWVVILLGLLIICCYMPTLWGVKVPADLNQRDDERDELENVVGDTRNQE